MRKCYIHCGSFLGLLVSSACFVGFVFMTLKGHNELDSCRRKKWTSNTAQYGIYRGQQTICFNTNCDKKCTLVHNIDNSKINKVMIVYTNYYNYCSLYPDKGASLCNNDRATKVFGIFFCIASGVLMSISCCTMSEGESANHENYPEDYCNICFPCELIEKCIKKPKTKALQKEIQDAVSRLQNMIEQNNIRPIVQPNAITGQASAPPSSTCNNGTGSTTMDGGEIV